MSCKKIAVVISFFIFSCATKEVLGIKAQDVIAINHQTKEYTILQRGSICSRCEVQIVPKPWEIIGTGFRQKACPSTFSSARFLCVSKDKTKIESRIETRKRERVGKKHTQHTHINALRV